MTCARLAVPWVVNRFLLIFVVSGVAQASPNGSALDACGHCFGFIRASRSGSGSEAVLVT